MTRAFVVPRWALFAFMAVCAGGLVATGTVLASADEREPGTGLAEQSASGALTTSCATGPREHAVGSATSDDGLRWVLDDDTVVEHASVPDSVVLPNGDVLLVYVDASEPPETAAMMRSTDGGATFEPVGFAIEGIPADTKVLDPNLVVLPDGRVRLYYFGNPVDQRIAADAAQTIYSAISDDGVHFVQEGVALEARGLVDPDIFPVGDEWVMYVFGQGGTMVARSDDGLTFSIDDTLSLERVGTTGPIEVDGRLRLYGFEQVPDGPLVLYESIDGGASWSEFDGFELTLPADASATDPQVVQLDDGTWRMYLKLQEAGAACGIPGG